MATASQSTFYPDPNMGMVNQSGTMSGNPMQARAAMDKYFRAYWDEKAKRETAVENRQMWKAQRADERVFKGEEIGKTQAWKSGESAADRASKDKEWEITHGGGDFAWVQALTQLAGDAAIYDKLYNDATMSKAIFSGAADVMDKFNIFRKKIPVVDLQSERDEWNNRALPQQAIPYNPGDMPPTLPGA